MTFQRGDIVLIRFPYSDLSTHKTRPAVVINSDLYHTTRAELLLAYVSSQIGRATSPIDYILTDWSAAGLLKPSFVRPKVAAIEPSLVVHRVGRLIPDDLLEVDRCLRRAMSLTETALVDVVNEIDLTRQPPALVQQLAERSTTTLVSFLETGHPEINLTQLHNLLSV
jgi:mRNA interferase MazF